MICSGYRGAEAAFADELDDAAQCCTHSFLLSGTCRKNSMGSSLCSH